MNQGYGHFMYICTKYGFCVKVDNLKSSAGFFHFLFALAFTRLLCRSKFAFVRIHNPFLL